jgi:hypothetical protein
VTPEIFSGLLLRKRTTVVSTVNWMLLTRVVISSRSGCLRLLSICGSC